MTVFARITAQCSVVLSVCVCVNCYLEDIAGQVCGDQIRHDLVFHAKVCQALMTTPWGMQIHGKLHQRSRETGLSIMEIG